MKMNNIKRGFTLVELMVFFLFITILIAASTPLITRKAKEIPLRVTHGKYICYYDNSGNLMQDYYNSTRRVSSEPVTSCSFKPPRRASVFKVELIGAGAGGCNHFTYDPKSQQETKNSELDQQYWGFDVPEDVLQDLFNGAEFAYMIGTGSAGDGGTAFTEIATPSQKRYDYEFETFGEGLGYFKDGEYKRALKQEMDKSENMMNSYETTYNGKNAWRPYSNPLGNLMTTIANYYSNYVVLPKDYVENGHTIKDLSVGNFEILEIKGRETIRVDGTAGEKEQFLTIEGNLKLSGTNLANKIKNTLQTAKNGLGSVDSKNNCAGWQKGVPPTPGRDGEDNYAREFDSNNEIKAENGTAPTRFPAFMKDNVCYTPNRLLRAGNGGVIKYIREAEKMTNGTVGRGDYAPLLVDYTEREENTEPYKVNNNEININGTSCSLKLNDEYTQIIPRISATFKGVDMKVEYGDAGGAGQYKVVYLPMIPSTSCAVTVGRGGAAINDIENTPELTDTSLTCEDTTYTASAGKYATTYKDKTFPMSDYLYSYDDQPNFRADGTVGPEPGGSSGYKASIFTKLIVDLSGIGKGGDGVEEQLSWYPIQEVSYSGNGKTIRRPFSENDGINHQHQKDATPGKSGAVIITW